MSLVVFRIGLSLETGDQLACLQIIFFLNFFSFTSSLSFVGGIKEQKNGQDKSACEIAKASSFAIARYTARILIVVRNNELLAGVLRLETAVLPSVLLNRRRH